MRHMTTAHVQAVSPASPRQKQIKNSRLLQCTSAGLHRRCRSPDSAQSAQASTAGIGGEAWQAFQICTAQNTLESGFVGKNLGNAAAMNETMPTANQSRKRR